MNDYIYKQALKSQLYKQAYVYVICDDWTFNMIVYYPLLSFSVASSSAPKILQRNIPTADCSSTQ